MTTTKQDIAEAHDPLMLAEAFLADYVHVEGDILGKHDSLYALRKWRGEYYHYAGGRYRRISDDTLVANITANLQQPTLHGMPLRITRTLLSNILLNIDPMILIRETCEMNTWIEGADGGRVIPVQNGLLSLSDTGRTEPALLPHTPRYFCTACLPYVYDPGARCPIWETTIKEIFSADADLVRLLQLWFGYLLRPDLREQKFLLCVGDGANGKNVVMEIARAMVGPENCSSVPLSQFGDRFALGPTLGKIVNLTSESSHIIEEQAENVLKSYVSGDPFTFERKFREPVHAVPTAKLMIATNALPRFNDRTLGVWRRILLLPFDRTFSEREQVKGLAALIIGEEMPGILNWAIAGLHELNRAGGFSMPAKCGDLLEDYRRDSDPSRAFLLENYTYSPDAYGVLADQLYRSYVAFCEANGYRPVGSRLFGRQVHRIFPQIDRTRKGRGADRVYLYAGLMETCTP